MYRLEWIRGSVVLGTWDEVELHPMFLRSSIFHRMPFGWCAI